MKQQKVQEFTGEGAYHGSSKTRSVTIPTIIPEECNPTSLIKYHEDRNDNFDSFWATFPNLAELVAELDVPTQEHIQNDGPVFCWTPFETALAEAGPLTKSVLLEMQKHLEGKKKFVYVDSKIQYFKKGDLPVDSNLWHVDGSIAIRDQRATDLGFALLHDMKARFDHTSPPNYLAYQSSTHCATQFANESIQILLKECIPDFKDVDNQIKFGNSSIFAQPAGSIIKFNGLSLHRAVPATGDGWRLWIRVAETDKEVILDPSVKECYQTVFRKKL